MQGYSIEVNFLFLGYKIFWHWFIKIWHFRVRCLSESNWEQDQLKAQAGIKPVMGSEGVLTFAPMKCSIFLPWKVQRDLTPSHIALKAPPVQKMKLNPSLLSLLFFTFFRTPPSLMLSLSFSSPILNYLSLSYTTCGII